MKVGLGYLLETARHLQQKELNQFALFIKSLKHSIYLVPSPPSTAIVFF
jgi:hypothetical protein